MKQVLGGILLALPVVLLFDLVCYYLGLPLRVAFLGGVLITMSLWFGVLLLTGVI
jgi:hypothetical protein